MEIGHKACCQNIQAIRLIEKRPFRPQHGCLRADLLRLLNDLGNLLIKDRRLMFLGIEKQAGPCGEDSAGDGERPDHARFPEADG